jgi:hypothetical protein
VVVASQTVNSRVFYADVWQDRIEALFFGDFLLGQQKKVTRPPGRDPARFHAVNKTKHSAARCHAVNNPTPTRVESSNRQHCF